MARVLFNKIDRFKERGWWAFEGRWHNSFGIPGKASRWLIYGASGHGKTEFCMQLARYFCDFGRVAYVSIEQGLGGGIQEVLRRNGLHEKKGHLYYNIDFNGLKSLLGAKRYKPQIVIIDSVDYLELTKMDYKELDDLSRRITLVFVAWGEGRRPASRAGKAVEFMVDVKIFVKDFVAFPRSRYGGNIPFVIWADKAKEHHAFLNRMPDFE